MLSYEAGVGFAGVHSRHASCAPELSAALYDGAFVFDTEEKRLYWSSYCNADRPVDLPSGGDTRPISPRLAFEPDRDRSQWLNAAEEMISLINQGVIFQANLTNQWRARRPPSLSPTSLYARLRTLSPAPFGAFFNIPGHALLSASVERFLSMDASGAIETRPIKGTAPASPDHAKNTLMAASLVHNDKELAENLMITDLMRHDIGRVCQIGSVRVPQLCEVESFTHIHHLVSSITGQLRPDLTAFDLLRAAFPPGSVTGAPKHQALATIDQLEPSARGAYCGSLFRIGHDGALDSSVVIRSLSLTDSRITLGAGSGITTLSDPAAEFEEMCLKAAPILKMFAP